MNGVCLHFFREEKAWIVIASKFLVWPSDDFDEKVMLQAAFQFPGDGGFQSVHFISCPQFISYLKTTPTLACPMQEKDEAQQYGRQVFQRWLLLI